MAKYTSKDLSLTFNSQNVSSNLISVQGLDREMLIEELTPFGATDETYGSVGVKKYNDVTIELFYDDTAVSGSDAVFNALGTSATLLIAFGGTKTVSVSAIVKKYVRQPMLKGYTKVQVVLTPTGTVTEV